MTPQNPFDLIYLGGNATMRAVVLPIRTELVAARLPFGLQLGEQNVTPSGTHPVLLLFNDMLNARLSVPSLLPTLNYHEHHVGIPYTFLSGAGRRSEPLYFMPKLYLDNLLAVWGGIVYYGFAKQLAPINVTARRYNVAGLTGPHLVSFSWEPMEVTFQRVADATAFATTREMLRQPLVSQVPFSVGPFFSLADLDRVPDDGFVRPLRGTLATDAEYGQALGPGWFPGGYQAHVVGAFELRVPWRLGCPYPPFLFLGGSQGMAWYS